jgi:hypothetical protein
MKPVPADSLIDAIAAGKGVFTGHARQRGKEYGVERSGASSDSAWMPLNTLESILTGAVKRLPP